MLYTREIIPVKSCHIHLQSSSLGRKLEIENPTNCSDQRFDYVVIASRIYVPDCYYTEKCYTDYCDTDYCYTAYYYADNNTNILITVMLITVYRRIINSGDGEVMPGRHAVDILSLIK